jgi:hypothetical protein
MSHTQIQLARALELPSRQAILERNISVENFWHNNRRLLNEAWQEWDVSELENIVIPDETLLDAKLRDAVNAAWAEPTQEYKVRDLWLEVSQDVYQCQLFDPQRLDDLRNFLDKVADAKIPLRPPYGIVLNRHGAMLDQRSQGYLASPSFQAFYLDLMNKYMRPVARMLFPEVTGFDTQTFGFSIQYQAGLDTSLRLHTDASAATLNININKPDEGFTGSEVDFYDSNTGKVNRLSFKPGMAMIHRGNVAHAAQPITSGSRSNLVLWLYGECGRLPQQLNTNAEMDLRMRWSTPTAKYDHYAPF